MTLATREEIEEKIQRWTEFLFDENRSVGMFYCISQDLYVTLAERYPLSQADSLTENGVVLNPKHAGACLTELKRTESFVNGLALAVEKKRSESTKPVRIFYAGCGPFATLILPLTYRYSAQDIQITILDYHKQAVDTAVDLIRLLGKEDYLEKAIVADAVTYELAPEMQPDILLTETLQRALTQECQVSIVQNLLSQLPESVLMVPEEIRVSGLWTQLSDGSDNRAAETSHDVELGTIIRLNAETARSGSFIQSVVGQARSHPAQVFCLQTEIDVFGPWKLLRNESGLTCPHPMEDSRIVAGQTLQFEYEVGEHPGLRQRQPES